MAATPDTTTRHGTSSVAARFEATARRHANREALVGDGRRLDYATLESTSRAIAARIERSAGGRRGFVALLVDRKTVAAQATLATQRCGRAFVPLDGDDPDERLRFVLSDCEPAVLIAGSSTADRARALSGGALAVLEIDGDETPEPGFGLPQVDDDAISSVYYTSGSTGVPKGVTQTQRNAAAFADVYAARLRFDERDRLSHLWATCFAASNLHLFGSWLHGAALCCYDMRREGLPGLRAWLDRERVSVVHTFPTVLRALASRLAPGEKLAHVRAVDVAGEAAYSSDVEAFRLATRADAIFVNQLGASEHEVTAQFVWRHGDPVPSGTMMPAGTSPEGVRVRILRSDGTEAAAGEVGAIVVSSDYASPGYWRRPDLDAQMLPPDTQHPGRRCYVGGDRGSIGADGCLHFAGREGSRIKLRGHSVDLSEIDAALAATPGVLRAVTLPSAKPGAAEADRIVAYVSAVPGAFADAGALRAQLGQRIPAYMLPATLVFVPELPETSTGKVDRQALIGLAPPGNTRAAISNATPRSSLEATILAHLRELVRAPDAGMDDDFFTLGGDSLGASDLFERLARDTGKTLPAATIVKSPTARALARAFEDAPSRPIVAVRLRDGSGPPGLWCVPGMLGDPLWYQPLLASLDPALRVDGLSLVGLEGRVSIVEAASYCADTIVAEQPEGAYAVIGYSIGGLIAVEIARELLRRGRSVAFTGVIDTVPPDVRGGYMDPDVPIWRLPPRHVPVRARLYLTVKARSALDGLMRHREPRAVDAIPALLAGIRGRLQPRVTALFGAYSSHRIAPIDTRITVFRATNPPSVADPNLGWGRYARKGLRVIDVPGNHVSLMEAGRARVLGRRLAEALAAARADTAGG